MKLYKLLKSVLNQEKAPIVVSDLDHIIVYMNPCAIERYHKDLTGKSIKDSHPPKANEIIDNHELRTSELIKLDTFEHECAELLGQANITISDFASKITEAYKECRNLAKNK